MVHREDQEKNMDLNIHEYGIHCYNPTDETVALINTVTEKTRIYQEKN